MYSWLFGVIIDSAPIGDQPEAFGDDDLVLLGDDKHRLWQLRDEIAVFLEAEHIRLHPNKVHLTRTADGLDCLGYRVFPHHIRVRGDNGYRFRRRLKAKARDYAQGRLELGDVKPSVAAWIGHVCHADSEGLRRAVLGSVSFQRATDRALCPACGSRGRLEQQTGERPVGQPQQEQP